MAPSFPEANSDGGGTRGEGNPALNIPGQGRTDGGRMPRSGSSTPQPLLSCAPASLAASPQCSRSPLASSLSSPRSMRPFDEFSPALTPRRGYIESPYQSSFLATSSSSSSSSSLSSSASSASCSSVFARSPAVRGEVFEPQRARATETEAEAEKSCFDDATVHIVYPPDLFASGFLPRFWRGSQAAARRRSSSGDTGGGSVPLPGADARGQRLSWGRVSAEGLDCFDGDEDETLAVCKYLLATGQLADIPEWRPLQVLQGQLLQLAAVILPGDTVLEAGPVALEEWIRKFSTLSATVDLVAAEARGTNAKAGKTKSSALSCQFWEAQAFPIDAQESLSVEVTPYTYEVVQSTQSAPCADERRHVSPLLPTVSPPSFSEGVDTPQASLTGCGRREDRGEAKDRVQRAEEARREDGEEGAERGEEDRGEEGRVTRIDSAMLGKAGLPEDVLRQVSSERFCFIVDIRIPMSAWGGRDTGKGDNRDTQEERA